jgi:hypothetical protein
VSAVETDGNDSLRLARVALVLGPIRKVERLGMAVVDGDVGHAVA